MSSEVLDKKDKKFFFDLNIFDEDAEEEELEEDLPPPPPTFSEDELASAEKKAFQKGKQAGLQESAASREQFIAQLLEKISQEITPLAEAEIQREKRYEQEVVDLVQAIFEQLFPFYTEKIGFTELEQTISDILRRQEGQKHIQIYVHETALEGVKEHIETLKMTGKAINCEVIADPHISETGCRLAWSEGGAVKDPAALAESIRVTLASYQAPKDTAELTETKEENKEANESESSETSSSDANPADKSAPDGHDHGNFDQSDVQSKGAELDSTTDKPMETPDE